MKWTLIVAGIAAASAALADWYDKHYGYHLDDLFRVSEPDLESWNEYFPELSLDFRMNDPGDV